MVTTGGPHLATSKDFFMATDKRAARCFRTTEG